MKKYSILLLIIIGLTFTAQAREALRADDVIKVRDGKVVDTGILSDEKGTIFLEFIKGDFVNYAKDKQPFTGEILPPAIIDKPLKLPRYRMREILSFELLTDNVETVTFVDRYSLMHPKEYLRTTLANPDGLIHGSGIKFLTRIYDEDKFGLPTLWVLETEKESVLKTERKKYWKKIGGKLVETEESGVKVFSAVLNRTGVYGLFDEDPTPYYSPNTPLETVQKVEASPYPSVVPQAPALPITPPQTNTSQATDEDFYFDENDNLQLVPAVNERKNNVPVIDNRIIPAIQTPIEVVPAVDTPKVPPVSEFQNLQSNNPNIKTLPVTGASLTQTPSSHFPFVLLLAFGLLGGSFYLAFKKQY